jgi:16S rRNA processing protein RimM
MTTDKDNRRVLLGEIAGVHGIRGDVLVRSYTAEPGAVASYGPLTDKAGTKRYVLKVVRVTDKGIVARIAGITDRTTAETLRGTELYVERAKLPEAAASEYYHADLIGLRAVDPDGTELGKIVAVQNFGAGDLLELQPLAAAPTEYIPFEDQWVPSVDLTAGTVVIRRPPESGGDEPDGEGEGGDEVEERDDV